MSKDNLIVVLSDLHSGSSTALFPNRLWQFTHGNHQPKDPQKLIWKHFEHCAKLVKAARKDKQLILVHDGDAIEGVHNGSPQIVTRLKNEQVDIHTDLMDWFMRTVDFRKGDRLYYTIGTEAHTDDNEELCAADLGAETAPDGLHVFNKLVLIVNGREVWFVHHGPESGTGANMGNSLRNFLRNIFVECVNAGEHPPDMVFSGHTHNPFYNVYVQEYQDDYHAMYGIICPSWQMKTRYGHKVSPVSRNRIGLVYTTIYANGEITRPYIPMLIEKDNKIKL